MRSIDAVIFDVGRVLVDIAPGERFAVLMRSMGIVPERAFQQYWNAGEVRGLMTGALSPRRFYETARDRFRLDIGYQEFVASWCDIFLPRPDMEAIFAEVADRHRVGLLSDTDPLHWRRLLDLLPWLGKVAKPTLSFEVGFLKPHPALFDIAAACGVDRGRCLFIDDVQANVDGARACGMEARRYQDGPELRAELRRLGLLA